MNLEELKTKIPQQLQPWADEYGPALLNMAADDLKKWIDKLVKGDIFGAYQDLLEKMDNETLLTEWSAVNAEMKSLNSQNAESIGLQKTALSALLRILLTIAVAMVGL